MYVSATGPQMMLYRLTESGEGADHALTAAKELKLTGTAKSISGDDENLFVLLGNGTIMHLNAEDLSVKAQHKANYGPT